MRTFILVFFVFTMAGTQIALGQKKKKLDKIERKFRKYSVQKNAIRDTSFVFQASNIEVPFISSNLTGGYIHIKSNQMRIQELDWPENYNSISRINKLVQIKVFTIRESEELNSISIQFEVKIKNINYLFYITHSLNNGSKLVIKGQNQKTVQYSGTIKSL